MERKEEQQEKPQPMAKDQHKRKPEHHEETEKDKTVGKVDDPEGEHNEHKREEN